MLNAIVCPLLVQRHIPHQCNVGAVLRIEDKGVLHVSLVAVCGYIDTIRSSARSRRLRVSCLSAGSVFLQEA